MKTKIKNFLQNNRKVVIASVAITSSILPTVAHAADSVSTTISTSMQTIVTDTIASIAAIAPIGITIFGAMFAWKKGIAFFKQVTK